MKKGGKFFACGILAALMLLTVGFMAVAQDKGPETTSIKSPLFKTTTKAAVEFTHKKHYDEYKIACNECHHVMKDGKNVWKEGDPVQKCEACHNEATQEGEKKLAPDQQKLNLKIAFHDNCLKCHQKTKKEKADTKAPVTCTGCHPAQK